MKKFRALKDNPFFDLSARTNFVPAWDRIKPQHIMPAIEEACRRDLARAQKIKNNPAKPNFKNTVEALETVCETSAYILGIIFNLIPEDRSHEEYYETLQQQAADRFAEMINAIYGDEDLFARLRQARRNPEFSRLSKEKKGLYQSLYNTFIDYGVRLSKRNKARLYALEKSIQNLELRAQKNIKRATYEDYVVVEHRSRLKGLPRAALDAAKTKADEVGHVGKYVFTLNKDTYTTFMRSVQDRTERKKMWRAYSTKATYGQYDNRQIVIELMKQQREKARLLGYLNLAEFNMTYQGTRSTEKAREFLQDIKNAALPTARKELELVRECARHDAIRRLEPWDVVYYQEKLKKKALGYDEEALRPYFEIENVLAGLFRHYEKLLGLHFEETHEYPVHHKDVRTFNVTDARTGKPKGIIFMDLYDRNGKAPGIAWNYPLLPQGLFRGRVRQPIEVIVAKLPKSPEGKPTLLSHYDVETIIHELGHAAHEIRGKTRYPSLSSMMMEDDFVEFPSQINENWVYESEVLDDFAVHYKTGKCIPDSLKEKIRERRKYMSGMEVLEKASRGWLDMAWSRADIGKVKSVEDFEAKTLRSFRLLPARGALVLPSFDYIHGGGYDAAFYSYQKTEAMGADFFALFKERGLYNKALCQAFEGALRKAGTRSSPGIFHALMGRGLRTDKFKEMHGLLQTPFNSAANDNGEEEEVRRHKFPGHRIRQRQLTPL